MDGLKRCSELVDKTYAMCLCAAKNGIEFSVGEAELDYLMERQRTIMHKKLEIYKKKYNNKKS